MSCVDFGPSADYREDFGWRKIGESEVVGGGEGKDVAFSSNGLGAEEDVREVSEWVS